MSTLSQFGGGNKPPKVIVNGQSSGGSVQTALSNLHVVPNAKVVLSGTLVANTLASICSVSGSGVVEFVCASTVDLTSRTIRLKVTIDGIVAFDATSADLTSAYYGIIAIGGGNSTVGWAYSPTTFNTSLLIEVASSLSETDKVNVAYRYYTV